MKSISQVLRLCDCPETLDEAKGIIIEQGRSLENARAYRIKIERENAELRAKLTCWRDVANGFASISERQEVPKDSRLGRALMMHDSLVQLEVQLATT